MKRLLYALAATSALTIPVIALQAVQAANSPSVAAPAYQPQNYGTSSQPQMNQPQGASSGQQNQNQGSAAAPISPWQLSQRQVQQIQIALNKGGFDAGHVDGMWGSGTQTALIEFQQFNGLSGSGQLDQQTLGKLNVNINLASNDTQGQNMAQNQAISPASLSRSDVRRIQTALNRPGYDIESVDGIWGPDTSQAVMKFQRQRGLPATGQLDQQTASALGVSLASLSPSQQGNIGQAQSQNQASNTYQPSGTNQGQDQASNMSSRQTGQNSVNLGAGAQNQSALNSATASQDQTAANNSSSGQNQMAANSSNAGQNQLAQQSGQPDLSALQSAKVSMAQAVSTAKQQLQNGKIFDVSFDSSGGAPVYHIKAYQPNSQQVWSADINAQTGQLVGKPSTQPQQQAQLSQKEMKAINAASQPISNIIKTAQSKANGKVVDAKLQPTSDGTPNYLVTVATNGSTQQLTVNAKTGQVTAG